MIHALAAKFVATRLGGMLAKVPRWVWIGLAAVALVLLGLWWHGNKVEAFGDARYQAGKDARDDEIRELNKKLADANRRIAVEIRSKNDAQIRRNAADADALRVRGPGKGACAPIAAPASGGLVEPGRPGDAAVGDVHSDEREPLIGLPFAPTVTFAEQHDNFRTEALSWREWWPRINAEIERLRKAAGVSAEPVP